ncbi:MAG: hypothetical protein N2322_01465 [Terrimicrobiaceae bacterium]|nr:hypothetical protein [Terrimicrobiaceae bacterium]
MRLDGPFPFRVVCFALRFESVGFRSPPGWSTWVLGRAGTAGAAAFRARCAGQAPAVCVLAGLAGGLRPSLRAGDVLLEPPGSQAPAGFRQGRVLTCDALASTPPEKLRLWQSTGADVCDLETAHFRSVARECGFPLWSLRVVSDDAREELAAPGHLLCHPGTGRTKLDALACWLLTRPSKWAAFARMVRQATKARARLHAALGSLLEKLNAGNPREAAGPAAELPARNP